MQNTDFDRGKQQAAEMASPAKVPTLRKMSSSSTLCATPPANDFTAIIHSEEQRYIRKGYGLISATIFAITFFYLGPILIRNYWPVVMATVDANQWTHWKFMVITTTLWHAGWVAFVNLCMWAIYHVEHPFFERYKISDRQWPWHENLQEWRILVRKTIKLALLNSFVSLPLMVMLGVIVNGWDVSYNMSVEDIPDMTTLIVNITFCMICEDFAFHFCHRLLHWKPIYPYIHKIHHQYVTTIGIAAWYFHPFEFVIGAVVPGSLAGIILGKNMHYSTALLWTVMRVGETLDGHCGYEFSWSPYRLIPFSTSASYHDFHHSHNVGNFSSMFSLWDTVLNSNKVFYQHLEGSTAAQASADETSIGQQRFADILSAKLESATAREAKKEK